MYRDIEARRQVMQKSEPSPSLLCILRAMVVPHPKLSAVSVSWQAAPDWPISGTGTQARGPDLALQASLGGATYR